MLERALKLQNYFTQPFYIAEPCNKRPGATVNLAESLQTCRIFLMAATMLCRLMPSISKAA